MEGNNGRLELFKDIRSSIRGSDDYVIVGVDVAKSKHHAFFGTPRGKTLRKDLVFDNCIVGFEHLRTFVGRFKLQVHHFEQQKKTSKGARTPRVRIDVASP